MVPEEAGQDVREEGEGIVRLLSARSNLFSCCFFCAEVSSLAAKRIRHCTNSEQGFILTARPFINPIRSATAYGFHIDLQARSARLVSFSHLIWRLKATDSLAFAQTH